MDKLTWFKFSPSDYMMGKIQRCPEVTQARFTRLCCLYWNKECELSIDDAIIEIDKEHFDVLVSKKIISVNETNMNIAFLDEQFLEIKDESKNKSKSGIIGNLKRWYPSIYADFLSKKISLEDAVKLSKVIARQSHTDSTPIAEQSQSIAEKRRQEKTREDKRRQDKIRLDKTREELFNQFWDLYGKKVGKEKTLDKFCKISNEEIELIFEHVPKYVKSTPDVSFRKNPLTYLNGKCWNDEIIEIVNLSNKKAHQSERQNYEFNV